MAYSTQKDFFSVPSMEENVACECKETCVKFKTYESATDGRSWATNEAKQTRYFSELVTCQCPTGPGEAQNGPSGSNKQPRGSKQNEQPDDQTNKRRSTDESQSKRNSVDDDTTPQRNSVDSPTGGTTPEVGDSVVECLVRQFSDIERLLGENKELKAQLDQTRDQLQVSDERLRTANMESGQLKSILYEKFDNYRTRDFLARLPELTAKGEITQAVADELIDLYHTCEVLRAENANFKVLIEMLYQRGRMEDVEVEDETSTDPEYLQAEVKRLRQEVSHLRQYEDAKLQIMSTSTIHVGDKYVNALKEVMRQRDEMRLKCKHLAKYKKNFAEVLEKAREAKEQKRRLSDDLSSQALVIRELEQSTNSREELYKRELERYKSNERRMKSHIQNLECEYKRHVCELNEAAFLVSHLEQQLELQEERYEGIVQKARKFQQNGYRFCPCNSSKTLDEICKTSSIESGKS